MSSLPERLESLRKRLLVANLRSRSLRLAKTTRSGAFDLARLATIDRKALSKVLAAMGRADDTAAKDAPRDTPRDTVDLLSVRGGTEDEKRAAEDLRLLAHAAHRTWMDVGEDELVLGWPFIEARLEGTWLRAPLLLYPASLARSRTGKLVWRLTLTGRPDLNEVLVQTLFRLTGTRLDLDALYALDQDQQLQPDIATWTAIRTWLSQVGLLRDVAPETGREAAGEVAPAAGREAAGEVAPDAGREAAGDADHEAAGDAAPETGREAAGDTGREAAGDVAAAPGPALSMPRLEPLPPRLREHWDAVPEGSVELAHHLVLGRFPQSSSSVLGDYHALAEQLALLERGPAADLLAVDLDGASDDVPNDESGDEAGRPRARAPMPELRVSETAPGASTAVRVLSSDASQEVVLRALAPEPGRPAHEPPAPQGLVVRGPPGTGKSQLITNLVGQAIDRGESVLVVCQKRAALDVVATRLAEVGLAEPLAVVHDVQHDRTAFCTQLAHTLSAVLGEDTDTGAATRDEDAARARYQRACERTAVRLEASHEAYAAMMVPGPGGAPLAALLERALDDDGRPLPDLVRVAGDVVHEDAVACVPALERAVRRTRPLAAPHPLAARTDWASCAAAELGRVRGHLETWRAELLACAGAPGVPGDAPGDVPDHASMTPEQAHAHRALWAECAPLLDLFSEGEREHRKRFGVLWTFTDAGQEDSGFARLVTRLRQAQRELGDVPPGLYATSGATLAAWQSQLSELSDFEGRWWRGLVPRFWRLRRRRAEVRVIAATGADVPRTALIKAARSSAAELAGLCHMTLRWHELVREVSEILDRYPFYHFGCQGQRADLDLAVEELDAIWSRVEQVHRLREVLGAEHPVYADLPDFDAPGQGRVAGSAPLPPFLAAALADRTRARRFAQAGKTRALLAAYFESDWLNALLDGAGRGTPDPAPIDAVLAVWDQASAAAALDVELAGLPVFGRAFLRGYRSTYGANAQAGADLLGVATGVDIGLGAAHGPERLEEDLVLALERAWRRMARGTRALHEVETALVDESQRAGLAAAHAELVASTGPAVHARYRAALRAAAADPARGRDLRKLLGEVRKRRHRRSIRQIVEAFWSQGLRQLRPVWLCSPDSVAALFPLAAGMFDLVILDEASQCPVESALPALVRGRRVLVAGDEKQMPPSHFFASRDEEDEEDEDPGALLAAESILGVASVAYPGLMLRYHYRSRHEELIAFSNHAFYDGRLVTAPPAVRTRAAHEGLHFERVDGQWRDQVNEEEARAVVARVVDLLGQQLPEGRPSVGVVTFNQKQRERIEALLDAAAADDERVRAILGDEWERPATEALFVKNLENVQGDERDIIVFSMGYGPATPGGRMAARFGPVGQAGGENRLNVAITRARTGVYVLASFTPDMLDVAGTQHLGPKLLRLYLDYVYDVAVKGGTQGGRLLAEALALTGPESGPGAGQARGHSADHSSGQAAGHSPGKAPGKTVGPARVGLRVREELATALERAGLVVARDLGIGPHRLDLAVRRRAASGDEPGDRWDLGVDCTRFLGTADPVQRDVTEPAFWRRAGWRIVRVSPALWLERQDAVVQAILELAAG